MRQFCPRYMESARVKLGKAHHQPGKLPRNFTNEGGVGYSAT